MKIMVVSDFHGRDDPSVKLNRLVKPQKYDLIIVCGDFTSNGPVNVGRNILETLVESGVPVLYVLGNMDPPELMDELKGLGISLHGRGMVIDDVGFAGAGFRVNLGELLEQGIREITQATNFLVIITHIPPYGTMSDLTLNGSYIGDYGVKEIVKKYQPNVLLCGHVHEARGLDRMGKTLICNSGPVFRGFYAELQLTKTVEVKLLQLT